MTFLQYLTDSSLSGEATILSAGNDGRPYLILDRTLFHRAGGGQRSDRGSIGELQVVDVLLHRESGETRHYVEQAGLCAGEKTAMIIDKAWRDLNSRCHTGGHLIAAVIEKKYPHVAPDRGHHWPGECRVECGVEQNLCIDVTDLSADISATLAEVIASDVMVAILHNPNDGMRHVKIGRYDAVGCGGTHVTRTGELDGLQIKAIKIKSGRMRISYDM
ncbi:MAG: hypothetical protein V4568_08895 [Pseudomonadota bacterium]